MVHMKEEQHNDMTTEVMNAERDVARTKQRFQESLQLAGETGSRLVAEMRAKATPKLLVAVVVSGAVVAGAAFMVARREPRRHRRTSNAASPTGALVRAVGVWLLRAAALRLTATLVAKLGASAAPALASPRDS
jgi:hypothetical protein